MRGRKLKHLLRERIPLTGGNGSPAISHTLCGQRVAAFRGRIAPAHLVTCTKCLAEMLSRPVSTTDMEAALKILRPAKEEE